MSNLKGLASIAKGLSAEPTVDLIQELDTSASLNTQVRTHLKMPVRPLAKTRNQDYKRVMILVKKATEKMAYRRWEDTHPDKDFSDLVETLLKLYADGQISA